MPQFDVASFPTQIFWLVICFVVLYVLMARIALPRISQVLEERQKRIDDNLNRALALKDEADAAQAEYEKTMAEAREAARAALHEASQDMANEAQERHAELEGRLSRDLEDAEQRIADAKNAAIADIREAAADVAVSATQRLIGTAPAPERVRAAIDGAMEGSQ